MASTSENRDRGEPNSVTFVREEDGTITARDEETGLARGGDSRAEALAQLAEVLELHEGGGESIDDSDAFLREELDIHPDDLDETTDVPEFMR